MAQKDIIVAYKTGVLFFDDFTLKKFSFLEAFPALIKFFLLQDDDSIVDNFICQSKDTFDRNFVRRYGWKDDQPVKNVLAFDDDLTDKYNTMKKYIEAGFNIAEKRVDVGSEEENIIRLLAKSNKDFIVLYDDDV